MVVPKVAWRGVAAAIFCLFGVLGGAGAAGADPTMLDVSDQPVVIIQHSRPLMVRTWDRQQIAVDSGAEGPMIARRPTTRPGSAAEGTYPVPIPAEMVPMDPAFGEAPIVLGAEEFPVTTPPGNHESIRIQLPPNVANVTVPANTSVLVVGGGGNTGINDYHGQLIVQQRFGATLLRGVSGDAYVQNLRGPVFVQDSTFNRLRTRTALSNTIFQRCMVKQIEASSVRGSILFDDGAFQPGLARFDTVNGHVAIGVNGGANIGVRGSPGQIFQNFDRNGTFVERGNGEATASVGGGGPLVNVITQQGKVFLYNGSVAAKGALPPHWGPVRTAIDSVERQRRNAPVQVMPPPPQIPARPHRVR